jgi:hypothetical protein
MLRLMLVLFSCFWFLQSPNALPLERFPIPPASANRLFYIQRSSNANTVVYDANFLPNKSLNPSQPVHTYWIRFADNGQKEELNFIQRTLAYGLYTNKIKNEERVILPLKVVANAADLLVPSSNNAFITTTAVSGTSILTSDSIGQSLAYQASSTPVARIFITQGSGTVIASVTGPGLLSSTSLYAAGRVLILNRSLTSVLNLYLFPDGTQGRSTISITVSGQANIKTINFGNFGGASPTPTVKPTISPKPTTSENPKTLATPTPTVTPTISPKPTTSENPKTLATPTPAIKKSVTINCSNGKSTKKVTGTNPKCPSGYKKA